MKQQQQQLSREYSVDTNYAVCTVGTFSRPKKRLLSCVFVVTVLFLPVHRPTSGINMSTSRARIRRPKLASC